MKISKDMMAFWRAYWHQGEKITRARLEKLAYEDYRAKRSKMRGITEGKRKRLTRKYVERYKEQNEPRLMRCSYDLEKGSGTRESPSLIFEFQFFIEVGRADAERWADGETVPAIRDEALKVFTRIADRYRLSGDMQTWLAGGDMLGSCDRRYAEAEHRDKNFIRLVDNRGTGEHVRMYVDY